MLKEVTDVAGRDLREPSWIRQQNWTIHGTARKKEFLVC
jgi:hypothetical protein